MPLMPVLSPTTHSPTLTWINTINTLGHAQHRFLRARSLLTSSCSDGHGLCDD